VKKPLKMMPAEASAFIPTSGLDTGEMPPLDKVLTDIMRPTKINFNACKSSDGLRYPDHGVATLPLQPSCTREGATIHLMT